MTKIGGMVISGDSYHNRRPYHRRGEMTTPKALRDRAINMVADKDIMIGYNPHYLFVPSKIDWRSPRERRIAYSYEALSIT